MSGSPQFAAVRELVKERYHKAIAQARKDYCEALKRIKALERELFKTEPGPLGKFIDQVIPTDKPFTIPDIMAGLKALDPVRKWEKKGVQKWLGKLRARGTVRMVTRPSPGAPTV